MRDPEAKAEGPYTAPKWGSQLDIYLEREDTKTERLAARLNLNSLGWTTNLKRKCGSIRHVWIMELADGTSSPPIAAAA